MDPTPEAKADRVWREKRGLHDYGPLVFPSIPLIAPSPVSGLVHEDDVPRDEPSIPLSSVVEPSPVSGLEDEEHRYPKLLPLIFEFLSSGERRKKRQVSSAWWAEVNICLAMLSTRARHPYIEVFLGSWKAQWELMNKESVALMRRPRPHVWIGRYHEC